MTHLLFADDIILFGKTQDREAYELIQILNKFTTASGQLINIQKSGLIFGKQVTGDKSRQISIILNIQAWDNPGKYLGVPAQWDRSKTSSLAWIKSAVMGKLEG